VLMALKSTLYSGKAMACIARLNCLSACMWILLWTLCYSSDAGGALRCTWSGGRQDFLSSIRFSTRWTTCPPWTMGSLLYCWWPVQ
jgi:hypothetical protein